MKSFEYFEPRSLQEVTDLLRQYRGRSKVLAGGTDLLIKMKKGTFFSPFIVNLKKVEEMKNLRTDQGGIWIGVLTSLRTIQKSKEITEHFPLLAKAASSIGSKQIRNMGTVGGNLCLDPKCIYYSNSWHWLESWSKCWRRGGEICHVRKGEGCDAIFSGDLAVPLIALGTQVYLTSSEGDRSLPLENFYTGCGRPPNILKEGEILKDVFVPFQCSKAGTAFIKHAKRGAVDFSILTIAVNFSFFDGKCDRARVVLGQASSSPVRLTNIESFLTRKRLDSQVIMEASRHLSKEEIKISNADGLAAYKLSILEPMLEQAMCEAFNQKCASSNREGEQR